VSLDINAVLFILYCFFKKEVRGLLSDMNSTLKSLESFKMQFGQHHVGLAAGKKETIYVDMICNFVHNSLCFCRVIDL
jgi:hypothetical protein